MECGLLSSISVPALVVSLFAFSSRQPSAIAIEPSLDHSGIHKRSSEVAAATKDTSVPQMPWAKL